MALCWIFSFLLYRTDDNDFLVQLCRTSGKLLKVLAFSSILFNESCCISIRCFPVASLAVILRERDILKYL
jgi:hypothetical protein